MNHCKIIFISTIFFIFSAKAQTTKRNLLQQFSQQVIAQSLIPKKQWKPFPQTPGEWKSMFPDSLLNKIIKSGEAALKEEFKSIPATVALEFVRTGNRRNYQNLANKKRALLWDMALAESIEGKGRFADHLLDGIWSVCEESFWGATAHLSIQKAGKGLPDAADPIVDLFAAETASTLAWVDYFSGPALEKVSPIIRPRIRFETERRIFKPMQTASYFYLQPDNPDARLNNWTPWIMSNYITAGLLLREDEGKRAEALSFAMKYIDKYMNGLGEDGGCDEGPGYWFAAAGAVFDGLCLLDNATNGKVNIYKDPFIRKMASYIYKTHIAGENFINVADASAKLRPNGLMLYRFGKATGDENMMAFGRWAYHTFNPALSTNSTYMRARSLFDLAAIPECAAYPANYKDIAGTWFSDIQLMASRSSNGFFLSSHGGHNGESHNHNDVGDFMIYVNGYPMIIDVGPGNYTARTFSESRYELWFNTSAFHNLPVINGYQQAAGSSFTASNVRYYADKNSSFLDMEIAKAYPAESGILSWKRKVSLNKTGTIDILDHYRFTVPFKKITQSFMTVCKTGLDQPGKIVFLLPDGQKAFLEYDPKAWEIKKEKIELITEEDKRFINDWSGQDIWRILLTNKRNDAAGSFLYHIHK